MKKITTIAELLNELEKHNYSYYGLRNASDSDLEALERGYLERSHNWIDNEMTDELLNGTSAIYVDDYMNEARLQERYNQVRNYAHSNIVLLIADNNHEWGEDENEIILGSNGYGADVVAIVEI